MFRLILVTRLTIPTPDGGQTNHHHCLQPLLPTCHVRCLAITLWGIFLPAEMVSQVLTFFDLCRIDERSCWRRALPALAWVALVAYPPIFAKVNLAAVRHTT
jgi:hypothetical protein